MAAQTSHEIEIEAPFGLVWEITNDVRSWPSLFSEYSAAEILEERAGYVRFRLATHPDESGQTWSWVSERRYDRNAKEVIARRVDPGPFEYMNIRWTYEDTGDGRTVMRWAQDFQMKPTAPVTDKQMAARIDANSPVQLGLIKAAVESRHGTGVTRARQA
jgi:aromatase